MQPIQSIIQIPLPATIQLMYTAIPSNPSPHAAASDGYPYVVLDSEDSTSPTPLYLGIGQP